MITSQPKNTNVRRALIVLGAGIEYGFDSVIANADPLRGQYIAEVFHFFGTEVYAKSVGVKPAKTCCLKSF